MVFVNPPCHDLYKNIKWVTPGAADKQQKTAKTPQTRIIR
jgi:hypothetical protein